MGAYDFYTFSDSLEMPHASMPQVYGAFETLSDPTQQRRLLFELGLNLGETPLQNKKLGQLSEHLLRRGVLEQRTKYASTRAVPATILFRTGSRTTRSCSSWIPHDPHSYWIQHDISLLDRVRHDHAPSWIPHDPHPHPIPAAQAVLILFLDPSKGPQTHGVFSV